VEKTVKEEILEKYSQIMTERPVTVLIVMLVITSGLEYGGTNVRTDEQSTEDFLPDSVPSIAAFETIQTEFSTAEATSYTILMKTNPQNPGSNEIRDVRNPRFLRYVETVSNDLNKLNKVNSVSSPSDLFQKTPSSKADVRNTLNRLGAPRWSQTISEDYTAVKITVNAAGLSADEETELSNTIRNTVEAHDRPAGIQVMYTGQTYIDEAFQQSSQQTTSTTTSVALIGVLLVVILLFRSVYYGFTALQTLLFGIAAGFGLFGWLGYNLSPATSGAISIGVGIAIDFGIQPVSRYIEERKTKNIPEAIETTYAGVAQPMTLGVIGAILGFSALMFGRLTFLSSLGTILILTTFMAYMTAFLIIPPVMIIYDRYIHRHTSKIISRIYTKGEN
jgi:predicted RND superfamily exporter protein